MLKGVLAMVSAVVVEELLAGVACEMTATLEEELEAGCAGALEGVLTTAVVGL